MGEISEIEDVKESVKVINPKKNHPLKIKNKTYHATQHMMLPEAGSKNDQTIIMTCVGMIFLISVLGCFIVESGKRNDS